MANNKQPVELKEDSNKRLYACADNYEDLQTLIRDHEIKHVVRYYCRQAKQSFNSNYGKCSLLISEM